MWLQSGSAIIWSSTSARPKVSCPPLRWEIATKQFEGALIVGSYDTMEHTYVRHLRTAGIPFFHLSIPPVDAVGPLSYVAVDDYAGGYRAGDHLAKLGCKRLLHIAGPKDSRDALERQKGFLQACRDHGLENRQIGVCSRRLP